MTGPSRPRPRSVRERPFLDRKVAVRAQIVVGGLVDYLRLRFSRRRRSASFTVG